MQIGSLVMWGDANGNPEYGIVVEVFDSYGNLDEDRVLVYFPEDNGNSFISIDELEVICK